MANGWSKALGSDRKHLDMFFDHMLDGFAYHKIVVDKKGKPVDYVFLEVNHAFERMTGLKKERIIGKKVTEALPGIEKDPSDLIGIYGHVALTGEPVQFENHVEPSGKWYNVSAYCPVKGYFVALLEDITERKKAEEAVAREAELIDLSPDAIITRTFEGTITFWSKGAEKLYGWTKAEAIGKVTHRLLKTEFSIPLLEIEKMQKLHGKWSGELTHTIKNGSEVVVQSFQLCQFGVDGKIESILESNIDITERKQQEREIESMARFPSENPNPIFRIDKKGTILYGNQAGASFLAAWNSKVGKHAPKHISQVATEALASDKRVELEETFGTKTFSLLFAPVTLAGYVNIYASDTTERKKAEEALKESEHLYRTVFDNSQDGFQLIELIYDENGKPYDHEFLRVNHAYEKIMGVKAKEVTGKTARSISPNLKAYWFEVPDRVVKTGKS